MRLNVYNSETRQITVVTDFETVVIPPKESRSVRMEDDAVFNKEDAGLFYVEEKGDWRVRTKDCVTGCDVEIYDFS